MESSVEDDQQFVHIHHENDDDQYISSYEQQPTTAEAAITREMSRPESDDKPLDEDDLVLLAHSAAEAKMRAAEMEHQILELQKKLDKYESSIGNPDETIEDDVKDDEAATLLWMDGNEAIERGEIEDAVRSYTSAMASILRRYQEVKVKFRAKAIIDEEVRQKWLDEKEKEYSAKVQEMEQNFQEKFQQQQENFLFQIEQSQKENTVRLQQQQASFEKQKHDFETALKQRDEELTNQKIKLAEMTNNLQNVCDELNQTKEDFLKANEINSNLETQLNESKGKNAELAAQMDGTKEKTRLLLKKHQTVKEELAKKDAQIDNFRKELDNAHAKAAEAVAKRVVGLEANIARLQEVESELAIARAQAQQEEAIKLREVERLSSTLQQTMEENDSYLAQITQLQTNIQQLNVTTAEQLSQIASLTNALDEKSVLLAKEIDANKVLFDERRIDMDRVQQLQSQLDELQRLTGEERENLSFECSALREDLATSNQRLIATESRLRDSELRLQQAHSEIASLESEYSKRNSKLISESVSQLAGLQANQARLEELQQKLEFHSERADIAERRCIELERESQKLAQSVAEVAKLEELGKELNRSHAEIDRLLSQLETDHMKIQALESENSTKSTKLEELEKEAFRSTTQVVELQACIDELKKSHQEQVDLLQAEISKVKSEADESVMKMQMEVHDAKQKLSESYNRIVELQTQASSQESHDHLQSVVERAESAERQLAEETDRHELLAVELDEVMKERNMLKAALDHSLASSNVDAINVKNLESELEQLRKKVVGEVVQKIPFLEANAHRISELEMQLREVLARHQVPSSPNAHSNEIRILELEKALVSSKESHSTKIFQLEADLLRAKDELELVQSELTRAKQQLATAESTSQKQNPSSSLLPHEEVHKFEKSTVTDEVNKIPAKESQEAPLERLPENPLRPRRASLNELGAASKLPGSLFFRRNVRRASFDETMSSSDLILLARAERDEAVKREQDLGAECEALRRKLDGLEQEAILRQSSSAAPSPRTFQAGAFSHVISPPSGNELEAGTALSFRERAESEISIEHVRRIRELENEISHLRNESSRTIQVLQLECEELKTQKLLLIQENLSTEPSVRRSRSSSIDSVYPRHRNINELESQTRYVKPLSRQTQDFTPESQSRQRPLTSTLGSKLRSIDSFEDQRSKHDLEEELKRIRSETGETIRNLQSECEALRRRIDELQASSISSATIIAHSDEPATTGITLPPHGHQRTISELESQREVRDVEPEFPDTPESQRHLSRQPNIRNPVRGLRLVEKSAMNLSRNRDVIESSKSDVDGSVDRMHQLEDELKRVRTEYSETKRDLQAECDALHRRLEDLDAEHSARDRATSSDNPQPFPNRLPEDSINALESQQVGHGHARVQQLEDELTRIRAESTSTIRNLQAETEALRRRLSEQGREITEKEELYRSKHVGEATEQEVERLHARIRDLEYSQSQTATQLETLQSVRVSLGEVANKDHELREALEKLQAGNETLDDLRTSLLIKGDSAPFKQREFGDRANILVRSIEQLQQERNAMKLQLEAAYGVQEEEEDFDRVVDAAHSAGDDALEAAKELAADLQLLTKDDDLANTLADALEEAQACLQIVLQLGASGHEKLVSHLKAVIPKLDSLSQPYSPEAISMSVKLNPNAELLPELQRDASTSSSGDDDDTPTATAGGEDTLESSSSHPPLKSDAELFLSQVAKPSEYFMQRIQTLEREKEEIRLDLEKAQVELIMRRDLFSFAALAASSSSFPQMGSVQLATPSKIAPSSESFTLGTPRSDLTPWKNSTYNKLRSAIENTPLMAKTTSIKITAVSNVEPKNEFAPQPPPQEYPHWQQPSGEDTDWATKNEWQPQNHMNEQGWNNNTNEWTNPASTIYQEQHQEPTSSETVSSWQPPTSTWSDESGFRGKADNNPDLVANPIVPAIQPKISNPSTEIIMGSTLPQNQGKPQQPTSKKGGKTPKKKKTGPGLLAIAFGIGTYHPEWKPDPKELEEDNSDFDEDEAHSSDIPVSVPTGLSVDVNLSNVSSDPFGAAAATRNSPRFNRPQAEDNLLSDPFKVRRTSFDIQENLLASDPFRARRPSSEVQPLQPQKRPSSLTNEPPTTIQPEEQEQSWEVAPAATLQEHSTTSSYNHNWSAPTVDTGRWPEQGQAAWGAENAAIEHHRNDWEDKGAGEWNRQQQQEQGWYDQQGERERAETGHLNVTTNFTDNKASAEWGTGSETMQMNETFPQPFVVEQRKDSLTAWDDPQQPFPQLDNNWQENNERTEVVREVVTTQILTTNEVSTITPEMIDNLTAEVTELEKKNLELKEELALEREARLTRESQFEYAESNLFNVLQEAEELKRKVKSLEDDLVMHQRQLHQDQEKHAQYQFPATPYPEQYPQLTNPIEHVPFTPAPLVADHFSHPNLSDVLAVGEELTVDSELTQNASYQSKEASMPTGSGGIDHQLALMQADYASKLVIAQETIENLQKSIIELQGKSAMAVTDMNKHKVPAASVEAEQIIESLKEDIKRLTSQLSRVSYALYRCKEDSSTQRGFATKLSLAVTTFILTAFVPVDQVGIHIANLLADE